MLHPCTELRWINETIGWGVVATAPIPRGTITWVQDPLDQVFDAARVSALPTTVLDAFDKYSYVNFRGERILCWDHGRYINHSCIPNVLSPGLEFDLALRNIAVGEQLVTDYGTLNLDASFDCACGTATCRGVVRPEDFEGLVPHWDRRIRNAFRSIARVAQPLWELLTDAPVVEHILARHAPVPSIAALRCGLTPAELALRPSPASPAAPAPVKLPARTAQVRARRRRAR